MKDRETDEESEEGPGGPREDDSVLAALVGLACKDYNNEVPITLTLRGGVITGRIVHPARYLDELGKQLGQGFRLDPADDVAQRMATMGRNIEGVEKDRRFIHLKDARFFVNGELHPRDSGFWWRGWLSAVDGFTLGEMRPGEG